jgi:hypothetical protein
MPLLGLRLPTLGRSRKRANEQEAQPQLPEPTGPPLVLLVPDIAGSASSLRLCVFDDAESAAAFLGSRVSIGRQEGIVAFWALHHEPLVPPSVDPDKAAESLILIRDERRPEIVCPYSFVEMETAQSLARYKVESGIDLSNILIFWAAPVTVEVTQDGGASFSPDAPPNVFPDSPPALPLPETTPLPTPPIEEAVPQDRLDPEPLAGTSPAAHSPVAPSEPVASDVAQAEFEPSPSLPETSLEDTIATDTQDADSPPAEEPASIDVPHPIAPPATEPDPPPTAVAPAHTEDIPDGPVVEQPAIAAVEAEAVADGAADEQPATAAVEAEAVAEQLPESAESIAQTPAKSQPQKPLSGEAQSEEGEDDAGEEEQRIDMDAVIREAVKVLNVRRWEERSDNFDGFDSPPGKF